MPSMPAAKAREYNGVREYLSRLSALYAQMEDWLRETGLDCLPGKTALNEEVGGRYDAPRLLIRTADGRRIAELEPVGAHVVGAHGRVDLRGAFDRIPIVYLLKGGPVVHTMVSARRTAPERRVTPLFRGVDRDGWYSLERREASRVRQIDKNRFLDLVRRVSDHAL